MEVPNVKQYIFFLTVESIPERESSNTPDSSESPQLQDNFETLLDPERLHNDYQ